jgi:large subunit ribosomal protein L15
MPTRIRKVRKFRGSRTHGWGQVGQHRASGQKGGVGQAGLHKHKWSWTVKYEPDHFGKDDMHPPQSFKPKKWVNVGSLDELFYKITTSGKIDYEEGKPVLNLKALGFEKLLGGGSVKSSYIVVVDRFTEDAKGKIVGSGGLIKGSS